MNNEPAQPVLTLQQINIKLLSGNLPIIPPARMQDILAVVEREKLIRAVHNLNNPAAFEYVRTAMKACEIIPSDSNAEEEENYQEAGTPNNDDQLQKAKPGPNQVAEHSKFHVYGGKAALCFEEDTTRGGVPTIALDAAPSVGPKTYDWKVKTRLQMTRAELPVVAAVLLGTRGSCEFKSHGHDNSKGFSMERQAGGKIFTKVFEKGQAVKAVPIEAADVFYVASLFLLQIRRNSPWLDAASTMDLVRLTMREAN